jgi:glycosyltransferase involved in cell wall biosynthesis
VRVLLLTQVLPYPPDSGPKIKTWNVLKYLARQHQVTLVSFVRGDQSSEVEHLRPYCEAIYTIPMKRGLIGDGLAMLRSLLSNQPWMMVRDDRRAMHQLLSRLASEKPFDIAHADQLNMAQYAQPISGAKKVLDAHNALWLLYKRLANTMRPGPKKWLLERDWRLLKTYEGNICREFDGVLAVSEEDKMALLEASGQTKPITVIPIAVDTHELQPVQRLPEANHILHIGTMFWPPNIDGIEWFLHEIFPLIRAERPDIHFDVVGARPPQHLLDLNQQNIGVNVTGYVKDAHPYLQQAGVMIVPLRAGGGMRVKILESLAQGMPVVSTTLGAEGIAVKHGHHLLIADTPEQFAQAVIKILADRSFADFLGKSGRELIERQYDFQVACQSIELAYRA